MSIKSERASSEIIKELNNILLTDTDYEEFSSVTLTYATVTNDLSYATIYFTTLLENKEEVEKKLNEKSSSFRTLLAKEIEIRHMPALRFKYDESIEYGQRIEQIIEMVHESDNK